MIWLGALISIAYACSFTSFHVLCGSTWTNSGLNLHDRSNEIQRVHESEKPMEDFFAWNEGQNFSPDSNMNVLDHWEMPIFEGGLFDSLPSVSVSADVSEDGGSTSDFQGLENINGEIETINWDDLDPCIELRSENRDEQKERVLSSSSGKKRDRREEQRDTQKRKKLIHTLLEKIPWSKEMNVKILTAHVDLMNDKYNPRTVTNAIVSGLEAKGASPEYIKAFTRQRSLNRHRKYQLEQDLIGFNKTILYRQAEMTGVFRKLEQAGVDFTNDEIPDLEGKSRYWNKSGLSAVDFDRVLRYHIGLKRGATSAHSFKLFREDFRGREISLEAISH